MALAIKHVHNLSPHPTNHLVKEFSKLVHVCQSYYRVSNIKWLTFWGTQCGLTSTKHFYEILTGSDYPPPYGGVECSWSI